MKVKDEFGDVIPGKSAIGADIQGTMSNSATSNAPLIVRIQLEDSSMYTSFYEYGREPQAKLPENEFITIKIKLANGDVSQLKLFLFQNYLTDSHKDFFNLLMSQSSPIKVIVDLSTVSSYESTIYNFEIDPTGLKNILKSKVK
jgi:hypothetical protein